MDVKYPYSGNILMLGFGSIGQGVLPLILKHLTITPDRITVLAAHATGEEELKKYGVNFKLFELFKENLEETLTPMLKKGDFLVNVSVRVSTCDLVNLCQKLECLYIDACIEPWDGGYTDNNIPADRRTNYALRDEARALKGEHTAILAHGANPGLVSHFVKKVSFSHFLCFFEQIFHIFHTLNFLTKF